VVALSLTDVGGNASVATTTVEVKDADALVVDAGPDRETEAGASIAFAGTYSDPAASVPADDIAWDMNYDGQSFAPTITGTLTPSFAFSTPGSYQVALRVTDATGASDISVCVVTVEDSLGPTVNAGGNQVVAEGGTASFTGSVADSGGIVSPNNVAWDFDYDGSTFDPQVTGTLTPTWQFPTSGDYQVALQVTDDHGQSALDVVDVKVNNVAPTVSAGPDKTIGAGDTAVFTGSVSDPGGSQDVASVAWDFGYDGATFRAGGATSLDAYHTFTGPGVYTVALAVTDLDGATSISTLQVSVNDASQLVVNAGADATILEGGTAAFHGCFIQPNGRLGTFDDAESIEWDFNYDGTTFVADSSAEGNLTPSHVFDVPGTYLVALRVTNKDGDVNVSTLYVDVANVAPEVNAGPAQTISEGGTATFAGTVSDPGGPSDITSIQWDFDYDGQVFISDPSADGSLTPSHQYTTSGNYEVAFQVTDASGDSSLATIPVTVVNIAPVAMVSNSGPVAEGSPVTFSVSTVIDPNPADALTYSADWTGTGAFTAVPSGQMTVSPDGTISFSHVYDDDSGPTGYTAIIRVTDQDGASTDYPQTVVVSDAMPTATFGPPFRCGHRHFGVPIQFSNAADPSHAELAAGVTYNYSINGQDFVASSSPSFLLPDYTPGALYQLRGYVEDHDGATSPIYTATVTVAAAHVVVGNLGTGSVRLTWTGAPEPVELGPSQTYDFAGNISGLGVTLETSGATYNLQTNGSIDFIGADQGVTGVNLTVSTEAQNSLPPLVGDGHIGVVTVPAGNAQLGSSELSLYARGDLGSVLGPAAPGKTGVEANDLFFANLGGSITGLDHIANLSARGWLGTDESQQVWSNTGIDHLAAYGIGATVIADRSYLASDSSSVVSIGDGGVTGTLEAGNLASLNSRGDVHVAKIESLTGTLALLEPGSIGLLYVGASGRQAAIEGQAGGRITELFLGQRATNPEPQVLNLGLGALFAQAAPPVFKTRSYFQQLANLCARN
jgi:PKD repeat protein